MAEAQANGGSRARPRDRWVKLIMALVLVGAAVGVYLAQLRPPGLPDYFRTDLAETLDLARRENRPVLLLLRCTPANEPTRFILGAKGLPHSQVRRAVKNGNYLCVAATVDRKLQSATARRYAVKAVPTLMVLSPAGDVVARLAGRKGHAAISELLTKAAGTSKAGL